ncbi:AI-2E family transporter [Duganella sp. BJB488]|uniref:AI-2E family transporter n=1 Tax=unclassified Duganella TaxID=2636909 RepID=UPI000E345AE5|nr:MULTISPECIES: AI-2E family transporter [unclassified Duganella]RFP22882.1 AI-2E family transporter [Duganella sp. BJB489]RFP25042.1 AI-2E family transporter [Duganella sp. BJB488]RFP33881.1 AI-2E family transporter [Duganella sp. BJB480]
MHPRFQPYTRLAAIVLLVIGCLTVLRPFLAAILFATAITISSWPLYLRLLARCKQRRWLAAATMSAGLTVLIIVPLALVTWNIADNATEFYEQIKASLGSGTLVPPAWLKEFPLVGEAADTYLRKLLGSREELLNVARNLLEPARRFLLGGGMVLGSGVAQVSLAVFVSFFLYRDGETLLAALATGLDKLIGEQGAAVADTVSRTVRGVMYGLLGTALAQAGVAAVGFLIAGVPAVALLSVATFLLSLIPVGPPLIWGGAAAWLFSEGRTGWGVFMLVWGFFVISGVDNVVKPMLISRGSSLPFILVLLGVMGGVLAFGFVGLFIGPTLLAVGLGLLRNWTGEAA